MDMENKKEIDELVRNYEEMEGESTNENGKNDKRY
jgi:hypothetical protein